MPAPCFIVWNNATGALLGTATIGAQPTAAVIGTPRTMLQIAPSASAPIRVIEWGYLFTTTPTAPVIMELIDTATVFASVMTAHIAANIHKYNNPTGAASAVQLGAALTAYSTGAVTEGTFGTANRLLAQTYDNALYFKQQFPLGREPEVAAGQCLRVRATPTAAVATSLLTYIAWEE